MIGSQGLMLAAGWPYQKIVQAVKDDPDAPSEDVARKILAACARNLLDFSLMDRSSEQAVCDLRTLRKDRNVVNAISKLAKVLKGSMDFTEANGEKELIYPEICDAVRLARLDAQSYWSETFVDVYDFCDRLLKRCNGLTLVNSKLRKELGIGEDSLPQDVRGPGLAQHLKDVVDQKFLTRGLLDELKKIAFCCLEVLAAVRGGEVVSRESEKAGANESAERTQELEQLDQRAGELAEFKGMVPEGNSYYIGPELQYSHGLSIYFPWTQPEGPFFFTVRGKDFALKTAFEMYKEYEFSKFKYEPEGAKQPKGTKQGKKADELKGDWPAFLEGFFKATLRKVRRAEGKFKINPNFVIQEIGKLVDQQIVPQTEMVAINLQKSSSDTGTDPEVRIKNYPRRNYLSPTDCKRKILDAGIQKLGAPGKRAVGARPSGAAAPATEKDPPVSYLGWNIPAVVAQVITRPEEGKASASRTTSQRKPPAARKR
jgi:hypothetical protein